MEPTTELLDKVKYPKDLKKFSDEDIQQVKQYYNNFNGVLSKQKILDKLLSDKNIKMGVQTYNKIIKDEY